MLGSRVVKPIKNNVTARLSIQLYQQGRPVKTKLGASSMLSAFYDGRRVQYFCQTADPHGPFYTCCKSLAEY